MDLDELARRHGIAYEMMGVTYNQVNPERIRALVNEVLEEAASVVMAERVAAEETQSEEDEAYNMALAHAFDAIQALKQT